MSEQVAGTFSRAWQFERVAGKCPMGCGRTLFLGTGGHVTWSFIDCPDPCAADELLHDPPAPPRKERD